eukprot:COSAG01_NODE_5097_length_4490_cov_17.038488_3_plen_531_part_00
MYSESDEDTAFEKDLIGDLDALQEQVQRAERERGIAGARRQHASSSPSMSQPRDLLAQTLRANREMQLLLRQQLSSVEAAKLVNDAAMREWRRDWARCSYAEAQTKKQAALEHGRSKKAQADSRRQRRYRPTKLGQATVYFTASDHSAPPPNADAARPAIGRLREMVPLVYNRVGWSKHEDDRLLKTIRLYCQQQRTLSLLSIPATTHAVSSQYMSRSNELQRMSLRELVDAVGEIDWAVIAKRARLSRSEFECRVRWTAFGDPRINAGIWSEAEIEKLCKVVQEHNGYYWEKIAAALGTNRTPIACFQQHQNLVNRKRNRSSWNDPEEDTRLINLVGKYSDNAGTVQWRDVATELGGGRTAHQCKQRYDFALRPSKRRGRWGRDEDIRLQEAVRVYSVQKDDVSPNPKIPWVQVARHVPGRTDPQCRERWVNVLHPLQCNQAGWSQTEDKLLEHFVASYKDGERVSWADIASKLRPRTDNQCLRRWKWLTEANAARSTEADAAAAAAAAATNGTVQAIDTPVADAEPHT